MNNAEFSKAMWAMAEGLALIALAVAATNHGKDAMVVWTSASDLYQDARKARLKEETDAKR